MTIPVNQQEFRLLRKYIEDQCGIHLGEDKAYLIENRLSGLADSSGCKTFGEFYLKLKNSSQGASLRNLLVDAISTNETFWFRDGHPFRILSELVLPELRGKIDKGECEKIHIWSAACSTGQEPYSIAMTVHDHYLCAGSEEVCYRDVHIVASDISSASLSRAKEGVYSHAAIKRGLPAKYLRRYFNRKENTWILDNRIKRLISFKQLNLKTPNIGNRMRYDIIFLRNVIIYFSEELKKTLLNRMAQCLNPGGYLFLGTGENLSSYTDAFHQVENKGGAYYRLKP